MNKIFELQHIMVPSWNHLKMEKDGLPLEIHHVGFYATRAKAIEEMKSRVSFKRENDFGHYIKEFILDKDEFNQVGAREYSYTSDGELNDYSRNYDMRCPFYFIGRGAQHIHHKVGDIVLFDNEGTLVCGIVHSVPFERKWFKENAERIKPLYEKQEPDNRLDDIYTIAFPGNWKGNKVTMYSHVRCVNVFKPFHTPSKKYINELQNLPSCYTKPLL